MVFGFVIGGCGERQDSASYYYSPSWTAGGNIIFIKGLQTTKKDAIGTQLGSSYSETVMSMPASGASPGFLFDATGDPPWSMSCSPTRNYVAYMDDPRGDSFGKIVIRNLSTEAYTGMQLAELLFSPTRIRSFDWSSDGGKIVYCTTQEVRIRDWNDYIGTTDTGITAEPDISFVSWKNGSRIAFVHGSPEVLSLIYPDGSGRTNLAVAASVDIPQISSANTNEVYGIAGGSYCLVDVSAGTPATSEIMANFKGNLPRLSVAADKVLYDKTGQQSGIYLLDIATKAETTVK